MSVKGVSRESKNVKTSHQVWIGFPRKFGPEKIKERFKVYEKFFNQTENIFVSASYLEYDDLNDDNCLKKAYIFFDCKEDDIAIKCFDNFKVIADQDSAIVGLATLV